MQNSQNKYEEEVNIIQMLWYCVSHWKSIVAVALIGLVLGCGFAVMSAPTGVVSQEAAETDASARYQITEDLKLFCEERMESLQEYVEETRILEFDAYDLYRGTITYKIDAPQVSLEAIYGAIYSYAYNGQLYTELAEGTGLYNANDLTNLVGITVHGIENSTILSDSVQGQMTVTFTVLGQTEEEAILLLEQTEESVGAYLSEIQKSYSVTSYSIFETAVTEGSSTAIADYQDKIRTKFTSEKEILNNYTTVLEGMAGEGGTQQVVTPGISKEALMKYGVLGFVAGAVLAIIVWAVIYILGGKLYAVTNTEERLSIKVLGSIYDTQKLNIIDRWIAQKRGGVYSALPVEEQRKIVLLNVKNELKKKANIKNVFLVSSLGENLTEADLLKSGLETDGYSVQGCGNVIGRADVLEQVANCDAVVVLENKELSKVTLVETEIAVLKEYVEDVLGMVVLGNKN